MPPIVKKRKIQADDDSRSAADLVNEYAQASRNQVNIHHDLGIVRKIELKNFMCHSHLEAEFGPNVNFVTGRNGSGKSALLSGLVVGLGGRASLMNRGQSVNNYIKTGQTSAEIAITLNNAGPDGYCPDIYGQSIRIVRKIMLNGSGGYKIYSEKGELIATKREELTRILDRFNIQVESPIAILNQDQSRTFLASYNQKHLYEFFMKATHLERIRADFAKIEQDRASAVVSVARKKASIRHLEKEVRELRSKRDLHQDMDKLRERQVTIENELAWSQVKLQRKDVEFLNKRGKQIEASMEQVKEKMMNAKATETAANKHFAEVEKQAGEISRQFDACKPERDAANQRLTAAKHAVKEAETLRVRCERAIVTKTTECEKVQQRVDELQNAEQNRAQQLEMLTGLQRKLEGVESKRADVENKESVRKHEIEQLEGEKARLTAKQVELRQHMRSTDQAIAHCSNQIKQIEQGRHNALARYHGRMPDLLEAIEKHCTSGRTRFRRKPRGPLGHFLTVKSSQKWAYAIETCLGAGLMQAFAVDNHDDGALLGQLCKQVGMQRPTFIMSAFGDERPYDVSRNVPHCQYTTVLAELDIIDPVVHNALVDQKSIEGVILVDSGEELRRIMRRPPHNCAVGYAANGDLCYADSYRYYSAQKGSARLLGGSVDDQINQLKADIDRYKSRGATLSTEQATLDTEMRKVDAEIVRTKASLRQTQEQVQQLNREIRHLKQQIDDAKPKSVDIAALEEDIADYRRSIAELEMQLTAAATAVGERMEEEKRVKQDVDELSNKQSGIVSMVQQIKEELRQADDERDQCKLTIDACKKDLKRIEEKHAQLEHQLKQAEDELQNRLAAATHLCPDEPVNIERSSESLDKELKSLKAQLSKQEQQVGDREEVLIQYKEKSEKLKEIHSEIKRLQNVVYFMTDVMKIRETGYGFLKKQLSVLMKISFIHQLQLRHYSGKLEVMHKEGIITITVEPRPDEQAGSVMAAAMSSTTKKSSDRQDIRGLSGGERSFATVCFILSLWQAMDSPFRCLDEFDVFMDLVNRRHAMEMILTYASENAVNQFILLTPLNLSDLPSNPKIDVRTFTLAPPRDESRKRRVPTADATDDNDQG